MIYDSFIVKIILGVYSFLIVHIKNSFLYSFISNLDQKIVSIVGNSAIVGFLTEKPLADKIMKESLLSRLKSSGVMALSNIAERVYKKFDKVIDGSILLKITNLLIVHLDLLICLAIFAIAFLPTMLIAVIILGLLFLFVCKIIKERVVDFIQIPLALWIISFILVIIYSSTTSFTLGSSLKSGAMYLIYMMLVFVIVNTINTKEKLFKVLTTLMAAAFLVALYGIYQKITGVATADAWVDADMFGSVTSRVYSTFDNPNVLGEYLILLIPIAFSLLYSDKKPMYKFVMFGITGALCLCLIFTQSRGAWLGLVAGMVFFAVIADRRLIVPGVIVIILIPFFAPSVMNRFMSIGNLADSSSNYRLSIILGSLGIIKEYWVSGIGLGLEPFALIYPQYSLAAAYALHSHNYYLQLIIETGIAGFAVMFLMIVSFYRNIFNKCIKRETSKGIKFLLLGIVAGTLAYFVQGMVENLWFNYRVLLSFWVVLGIGLAGVQID